MYIHTSGDGAIYKSHEAMSYVGKRVYFFTLFAQLLCLFAADAMADTDYGLRTNKW